MKILVVMKRFSSGKDQIEENFGREVRLASELQRLGHQVTILCADQAKKEKATKKLNGMKVEICPFAIASITNFLAAAKRMAAENEIIVATSHPLLGLVAIAAAKKRPVVYDVRDNYETYEFGNFPLLKTGIIQKLASRLVNNHVMRKSSMVTCASNILAHAALKARKGRGPVVTIPNGIDLQLYKPLPQEECRKLTDLPLNDKIITYSGGVRGAGIDTLIKAFNTVRERNKNAMLMLIGNEVKNKYSRAADASGGRIITVASVPYKALLYYLNASDVLVVAYEDNEFTRVMYTPYKLMDYMALDKPIVCTDVGEMRKVLKGYEQLICRPNDAGDMATKIEAALGMEKVNYRKMLADFTWQSLGKKLNTAIRATFKNPARVQ
ncbi:glycosyltransferase [Candidatus Woesearchaeota archaeon]|nr:glycosyltransferase [Candidatus Woesearchaeota archaeon]